MASDDAFTAALIHTCTIQRDGRAVTDATNASPIVVTGAGHGFSDGEKVRVEDVTGNTAANGDFDVAAATANTFALAGSTGDGAYVSGGRVWEVDGGGQRVPVWTDLATGVACRHEVLSGFGAVNQSNTSQRAEVVDVNLLLPRLTDITERDRIIDVVNPSDSSVVDAGPLSPIKIHRQDDDVDEHHVEAECERVRS